MSSVAAVKFIKTKVTFRYHTKGISNQASSYLDHQIKTYSCSKWEKTKKFTIGAGISSRDKEISNRGRDYKSGQEGFQIGGGITNRGRNYK